jgi:hypothetical protein
LYKRREQAERHGHRHREAEKKAARFARPSRLGPEKNGHNFFNDKIPGDVVEMGHEIRCYGYAEQDQRLDRIPVAPPPEPPAALRAC